MFVHRYRQYSTGLLVDVGDYRNEAEDAEGPPHVPAQEEEVQKGGMRRGEVSCERSSEEVETGGSPVSKKMLGGPVRADRPEYLGRRLQDRDQEVQDQRAQREQFRSRRKSCRKRAGN